MGKPPRNPLRAYDEQGKEIAPATVASVRALGLNTVAAFCEKRGCERSAIVGDLPAKKIRNWGAYLHNLKKHGSADKKVLHTLEQIKDL